MTTLSIYHLFSALPLWPRFHIWFRAHLLDFDRLMPYVGESGTLVDIGCGHGYWPFYVSVRRPALTIYGVDPDQEKIRYAKAVRDKYHMDNIRFSADTASLAHLPRCDNVTIIDVLYLIDYQSQMVLLAHVAEQLNPGGKVLIKEMDRQPAWKFRWTVLQETLAVRFLNITHGEDFFFRSHQAWQNVLTDLGLQTEIIRLDSGYPYPHILLTGEKRDDHR